MEEQQDVSDFVGVNHHEGVNKHVLSINDMFSSWTWWYCNRRRTLSRELTCVYIGLLAIDLNPSKPKTQMHTQR